MKSIDVNSLKRIMDLYTEKREELFSIINNLQFNDVKDDSTFNLLIEKLKQDFRIEPVIINQIPKPVSHQTIEKSTPSTDPFYRGTTIKLIEVTLHYDYTGSEELFKYQDSNPITYNSLSPRVIIQPQKDHIPVVVELSNLNREDAIQQANNIMALTFQIVSNNSKSVEGWNNNLDSLIDIHITKKREELIKFYS